MIKLLFLLIPIFIIYIAMKSHIHIKFKTFFMKGFKVINNRFGLFCYTGKQGTGKTYSAVNFVINEKLKNDYKIITNIKSFSNVFPDTLYMDDIFDIIDYCTTFRDNEDNIIILFDEIFTIIEKSGSLGVKILSFISQLRKRGIIFVTTAQEWSEINITFRRYIRYQISCSIFPLPLTKHAIVINRINDGDNIRWNNDTQEFEAPLLQTNIEKGKLSIIESYDTYETIATNFKYSKKKF